MKTAFLALGSNLGDRRRHLAEALQRLQSNDDVQVARVSSVYETAPVGVVDQSDFLNLVAEVRTQLTPENLLEHALAVEALLGRVRRERWGPRTLDIDLLWFEGETMTTATLTLPHPRWAERAFVVVPLAEIAPDLVVDGEPARVRALRFGEAGVKNLGPVTWRGSSESAL